MDDPVFKEEGWMDENIDDTGVNNVGTFPELNQ